MPQFAPKTVPAPSFGNELATRQARARAWFQSLRNRIVDIFESLEAEAPSALYRGRPGKFELTPWSRAAGDDGAECGGGVMGMMRGRLFEKVGVHISTVHGVLPEDFAKQVKGAGETRAFWASGVSLIAHTKNPRVPAVHMNTRMIATTECWFGGGADLNPTVDAQRTSMHPDAHLTRVSIRDFRNGRKNIFGCRTVANRAASAASSTTTLMTATGNATLRSPNRSARRSATRIPQSSFVISAKAGAMRSSINRPNGAVDM
jgi:hypothetical protein